MNKPLIVFVSLLLLPCVALGQGKIASIKKGQVAPFSGILLDKKAEASMAAKREASVKICEMEKKHSIKKAEANCKLSTSKLEILLKANKSKYDQLMKLKVDENKRLRQTIKKLSKPDYSSYCFIGGFVAGVGMSIGIFYAAAQASKWKKI